jgi:hypothetical protein
MKNLLGTISTEQSIAVKAALALILATAFTFSTGVALADEAEGAGKAGTFGAQISESTGLPDSTQPGAISSTPAGLAVETSKGETEGAGKAGRYAAESSESTGLPDRTGFEASSAAGSVAVAEMSKGVAEGAGKAGRYAAENSESTGLPDTTKTIVIK